MRKWKKFTSMLRGIHKTNFLRVILRTWHSIRKSLKDDNLVHESMLTHTPVDVSTKTRVDLCDTAAKKTSSAAKKAPKVVKAKKPSTWHRCQVLKPPGGSKPGLLEYGRGLRPPIADLA